jgi:hypothetical protein
MIIPQYSSWQTAPGGGFAGCTAHPDFPKVCIFCAVVRTVARLSCHSGHCSQYLDSYSVRQLPICEVSAGLAYRTFGTEQRQLSQCFSWRVLVPTVRSRAASYVASSLSSARVVVLCELRLQAELRSASNRQAGKCGSMQQKKHKSCTRRAAEHVHYQRRACPHPCRCSRCHW